MLINISEAKTHLSKLVDMVFHGEKVVIAKNNLPLVDLGTSYMDTAHILGGSFRVIINSQDHCRYL